MQEALKEVQAKINIMKFVKDSPLGEKILELSEIIDSS